MEWREGMRVEASSKEDGYGGAWFQGVILAVTTDRQRCKIEYDNFVTEDGKPLVEEEVCLYNHVRPIPPYEQLPSHYSVGDAVEAYDTDCWWRGVIIKLLPTAEDELWVVYFPDTCTLKAYTLSYLRPAQEWLGENWRLTPQERSPLINQAIRSLGAIKSTAASVAGRAPPKKKKLKITVDTVSLRQTLH